MQGNSCGCECGTGFERQYYTMKEKLDWLKDYEHEVETELEAVKEKIKMLEMKK